MIYTHVLNRSGRGVRSPADILWAGLPSRSTSSQLPAQPIYLASLVPPERQLLPGEELPDEPSSEDVDE
jgi:hypothetical protein